VSGMVLTVVGCSGSFAGPDSPASSYLVSAPFQGRDWHLLLDLGNGALGALQRHIDPLDLDAVAVSHLHADHCLDLATLAVMRRHHPHRRPSGALPVHAPAGAAQRLGRAAGAEVVDDLTDTFAFTDLTSGRSFPVGPFTVTPHRVRHPVETYGFRVEGAGGTLAYTGDTDECPELGPLLAGADLVLADSAYVDGRDDSPGVHLSASRAARAALDAGGVRRLVLTHLPSWNDPAVCRAQAAAVWPGAVELAVPGGTYAIPGGEAAAGG